jgi:hypothetical protein
MKDDKQNAIEPEIIAVIAAAIAAIIDKPHRILAAQPVMVPAPHLNIWAFEGRVELSMSHRIR